jgi:hypothetical protein
MHTRGREGETQVVGRDGLAARRSAICTGRVPGSGQGGEFVQVLLSLASRCQADLGGSGTIYYRGTAVLHACHRIVSRVSSHDARTHRSMQEAIRLLEIERTSAAARGSTTCLRLYWVPIPLTAVGPPTNTLSRLARRALCRSFRFNQLSSSSPPPQVPTSLGLHYSLQALFDEAVADSRKRSARMLSDQGIHVLGMESRQSGSRYIRPHACDYICLYDSQLPTRHRGTDGTDGTDDTYFGKTSRRYDT